MPTHASSESFFGRARGVLVGGVNSPVRAFAAVGGTPPIIARAKGSRILDIDGNEYIDYVCSYGPMILGHADAAVVAAIAEAAGRGTSYGAPCQAETLLAEEIVSAMPAVEKVRFVSSGTEAVMTALRISRAATGRAKIVKCAGCYHGHSDAMLVAAGSGAATLGVPSSPGVSAAVAADTLVVPYNDLPAMERMLARHANQVAAVLVEPVAANMGVVPPHDGYLAGLRRLCDQAGVLLVFDEVITGFRLGLGGAQGIYSVRPDLTTLGKIIGGGMPVGAVGGPAKLMNLLAPEGPVYQAGTLSGNPVAMAAGLATLNAIKAPGFYERLEARSVELQQQLEQAADAAGLAGRVCFNRAASMMTCFFTSGPVADYASAATSNAKAFAAFFHAMLDEGVYLAPSQYEAMFISAAHTDQDVAQTARAAAKAFVAASGFMENPADGR